MLHANFMARCFIEPELLPIEVLHCENRDLLLFYSCDLDLNPMTFIYEPDPYSLEIYQMCKYELPTSSLSSYRQTDTAKIIHHAASNTVDLGQTLTNVS